MNSVYLGCGWHLVLSESGKEYHVRFDERTGLWSCDCEDFFFRVQTKQKSQCKHVSFVRLSVERKDLKEAFE